MDNDSGYTMGGIGISRLDHLKQFYSLLSTLEDRLGGMRELSGCAGRMSWPPRGVYFFMEAAEDRTDSGEGRRVVRVGTHALKRRAKSTLWKRLRQHRGTVAGFGNHRGSVFRKIVGAALIKRDASVCPTWDHYPGKAPREVRETERPMERNVSAVIGAMPFLWLSIDDEPGPESQRGYIERNAIALLSNHGKSPLDKPSPTWLGSHCNRERVQTSGIWNSNHVDEDYDPGFLAALDSFVHRMEVPS